MEIGRCGYMLSLLTVLIVSCGEAVADSNFPGRRALIVNTAPMIELSGFSFENRYERGGTRFRQSMTWKNVGDQAVVAFEIVILKYDPFDRRLLGTRWTVTGTDSANWSPLVPGSSGSDGTISYGDEEVFTAVAYVRAARMADGSIWRVDEPVLLAKLRELETGIEDFGDVKPDSKPKSEP